MARARLLFHGTGADRATLDGIVRDGLIPHGGRAWAADGTGVPEHVFACTSPVGSAGGDPVGFANRGAGRGRDAWIVVLALAADDHDRVVGAVPNLELERYWQTGAFAGAVLGAHLAEAIAIVEHARATGRACRELLRPRVVRLHDGLVDGAPDAATLLGFEAAYHQAAWSEKARVAASYRVRIPPWFADDPHYPDCLGCFGQLFEIDLVATLADREVAIPRGVWHRLDPIAMGAMLDTLGRWLAAHPADAVAPLRTRAGIDLAALAALLPPPRAQVPRTFWPDFLTADLAARIGVPDTQLLLRAAPPSTIVGAIRLGDGHRFAATIRPGAGQTLSANLWARAHELRERHRATGRAQIAA